MFAEELKRTPDNPDAAWDRAMKLGAANGVFAAAGWAAFPLRIAGGPLKQLMFQAFGVQPAISVANKATANVITDQPVTEGLGNAYTEGAVMMAVPAVGHAVVNKVINPKPAPSSTLTGDLRAVGDRIADGPENRRYRNLDELYTNAKDDLNPFKVAEKAMTDALGAPLPVDASPYHLARLTRGSSGKASSWIDYETFNYGDGRRTGRGAVTGGAADRGRFKTPTLRGLALTAPYMHDGSLATLEQVVEFYRRGGEPNENLDPFVRAIEMSDKEAADLVAFLGALSRTAPAAGGPDAPRRPAVAETGDDG
jgi:hypothetical protein